MILNNPEYQICDKSPPRKTRPGVNGEDLIIFIRLTQMTQIIRIFKFGMNKVSGVTQTLSLGKSANVNVGIHARRKTESNNS